MRKVHLIGAFLLTGCFGGDYQPPSLSQVPVDTYQRTINKSFDEVWNSLIDHASTNFFIIDNVEKDSGLMTLSFGSSNPSSFIDCGYMEARSLYANYSGPYVRYSEQYLSSKLTGKMNILVRKTGENETFVRVTARYIFQAGTYQTGINTWAFDTGSYQTIRVTNPQAGAGDQRTCKPTHYAEQTILRALIN